MRDKPVHHLSGPTKEGHKRLGCLLGEGIEGGGGGGGGGGEEKRRGRREKREEREKGGER